MAYADDIKLKNRDVAITIAIALVKPSANTLYLTDRRGTYSGVLYEERIVEWGTSPQECDSLTGTAGFLTGSFSVQNAKLNYQAVDKTFGDILISHVFVGAAVIMQMWTNIGSGSPNSQTVFSGEIVEIADYNVGDAIIRFNCREAQKWNTEVPPTIIEKHDFPEAPEENWGRRVPLIYGSFTVSDPDTDVITGARPAIVPAVCIDKIGPTHGRALFRVCENDGTSTCHTVPTDPLVLWEPGLGEVAFIRESTYTTTSDTSKLQMEFDEWPKADVYIIPTEIAAATDCTDPGKAMDRDQNTYAQIDDAEILSLPMPATSSVGRIIDIDCYAYWDTTGADGQLQYGFWNSDTGAWIQSDTVTLPGTGVDSFDVTGITALFHEWRFITTDVNDDEFPIELRAIVNDDGGSRHCKMISLSWLVSFYPQKAIKTFGPRTYERGDRHMWG